MLAVASWDSKLVVGLHAALHNVEVPGGKRGVSEPLLRPLLSFDKFPRELPGGPKDHRDGHPWFFCTVKEISVVCRQLPPLLFVRVSGEFAAVRPMGWSAQATGWHDRAHDVCQPFGKGAGLHAAAAGRGGHARVTSSARAPSVRVPGDTLGSHVAAVPKRGPTQGCELLDLSFPLGGLRCERSASDPHVAPCQVIFEER